MPSYENFWTFNPNETVADIEQFTYNVPSGTYLLLIEAEIMNSSPCSSVEGEISYSVDDEPFGNQLCYNKSICKNTTFKLVNVISGLTIKQKINDIDNFKYNYFHIALIPLN